MNYLKLYIALILSIASFPLTILPIIFAGIYILHTNLAELATKKINGRFMVTLFFVYILWGIIGSIYVGSEHFAKFARSNDLEEWIQFLGQGPLAGYLNEFRDIVVYEKGEMAATKFYNGVVLAHYVPIIFFLIFPNFAMSWLCLFARMCQKFHEMKKNVEPTKFKFFSWSKEHSLDTVTVWFWFTLILPVFIITMSLHIFAEPTDFLKAIQNFDIVLYYGSDGSFLNAFLPYILGFISLPILIFCYPIIRNEQRNLEGRSLFSAHKYKISFFVIYCFICIVGFYPQDKTMNTRKPGDSVEGYWVQNNTGTCDKRAIIHRYEKSQYWAYHNRGETYKKAELTAKTIRMPKKRFYQSYKVDKNIIIKLEKIDEKDKPFKLIPGTIYKDYGYRLSAIADLKSDGSQQRIRKLREYGYRSKFRCGNATFWKRVKTRLWLHNVLSSIWP